MPIRLLKLISLICAFAVTLTACGGGDSDNVDTAANTQPTEVATAADASLDDILATASSLIANATSVHFTLKVEGDSFIDEGQLIRLLNASGVLVRPDRVSTDFQVEVVGAGNISIKLITIGDQYWTTDIVTGRWTEAPEEFTYSPAKLFDTQQGIGPIMGKLADITLVGEEELGGRDTWKVTGTASEKDVSELTSDAMVGTSFPVTFWIDRDSGELLQIVLAEPTDNGKDNPATWTMRLTDYNDDDVTIDAPI